MKRLYIPVAALALMAGGAAYAQTTTPAAPAAGSQATQPATPPTTPPSTEAQPMAPAPSTHTRHARRSSLKQRFDEANTTHDGHLTKAQAEASGRFKLLTRHWSEFDKTGKGYVTMADIHAYYRARHAARHTTHPMSSPGSAPAGSTAPAPGSAGQSQ